MDDILDSIDEIDDLIDEDEVEHDEDESEALEGVVSASDELDTIVANESSMTMEEARHITDAIRSATTAIYLLLGQARDGKAYKALGYETWDEYVREEFNISRQRSYQLIDWGNAIAALQSAAPEGTTVKLTEAQARDIKRELPKITEQIVEATRGLSPEDSEDEIDRIVRKSREQQKADDKAVAEKEAKLAEAEEDGYHRGLEAAADAMLEVDQPDKMTDYADDDMVEVEVAGDGGLGPADSMSLYNFMTATVTFEGLPEPDDFVNIIPSSRLDDIQDKTIEVAGWINRLVTLIELRKDEEN